MENNNNKSHKMSFEAGPSAKHNTREKRFMFDLNELPPSNDSEDSAYDCVARREDAEPQGGNGVQKSVSEFSFPILEGRAVSEDEVSVENCTNSVVNYDEIRRALKGKMPMNYSLGACCREIAAYTDAATVLGDDDDDDDEEEIVKDISTDEDDVPSGDEGSAIEGILMLHGQDPDAPSGSRPLSKRKRDFSEYYKPPCTRIGGAGPKTVIQVESSEDMVDDGYRWRKYGRKEIKGNPNNPRGYYRCTSQTCTARKQVERDAKNSKYVIVSYEGIHNHELPLTKPKSPTPTPPPTPTPTPPSTTTTPPPPPTTTTTTTSAVRGIGNTSKPSPPLFPRPTSLSPYPHYANFGFVPGYRPYGMMNYMWPNNNHFYNMARKSNLAVASYGSVNSLNFRNRFASSFANPHNAISGPAPGTAVPFTGFPMSPSLPPFDTVPYGHDFLHIRGFSTSAAAATTTAQLFPLRDTPPAEEEDKDAVPENE